MLLSVPLQDTKRASNDNVQGSEDSKAAVRPESYNCVKYVIGCNTVVVTIRCPWNAPLSLTMSCCLFTFFSNLNKLLERDGSTNWNSISMCS